MKRLWPLAVVLVTLAAPPHLAQAPDSSLPIDVVVPSEPTPVRGAGGSHLFYEVHLTNFSGLQFELTRVEIHGASIGERTIASYSGQEISSRLIRPGAPSDLPDKRVLDRGMRAVLLLHVRVESQHPVPTQIWHHLTFKFTGPGGNTLERSIDGGRATPSTQRPLIIDPPLRGGDWLAANGPSNDSAHRRALMVVNGSARIAQRLAIDWIKLGPGGRLAHDDRARNENWFAYGAEVLAVADGTVISVKDGIPENVPLTDKRAVPITIETIAGNHVVLDIGNGRYATYAHLIPKSLRVSVGAKVRRGQVLGLLGNSGNSDAPHLHFHVTDGPSAMGSEGVPYIFESVQHRGSVASLDKLFADEPWIPQGGTVVRTREIPLENAVIRFP
jgi:murein DD-endopeptidase